MRGLGSGGGSGLRSLDVLCPLHKEFTGERLDFSPVFELNFSFY